MSEFFLLEFGFGFESRAGPIPKELGNLKAVTRLRSNGKLSGNLPIVCCGQQSQNEYVCMNPAHGLGE